MCTPLIYITGAALMILMVQHSASQLSNIRAKQEAENRERLNFFDLDLLKVMASSQYGNLLISPASVKVSLAMLMEGAGGDSAKQVKDHLRLPDDERTVRKYFNNLLKALQVNKPPNVVAAGNRIFVSNTFTPKQHYQSILTNYYNAEIERVQFPSPVHAAQSINGWVNTVTHGQIPTLVDPGSISGQTNLMLASAMYFKGKWQHAFDLDKTAPNCFHVDTDQCFTANFMENVNLYNYAYIGSLQAHAVELPYEGNQFSLLLVMPNTRNAIQQLIHDLSHVSLYNLVSSLEATDVLISLPRFSIDYSTDLINPLSEVGIKELFSTNANLTGMVDWINYELHVSNFLHKAKIEVNEEGTVAAAATGAVVVPLMGTSTPKIIFNHPFLFFLRNTETGDILFAGRMSQPEAAKQNVLGTVNESKLQEATKEVFILPPVAGAGQLANPWSASINKILPVAQTQPPVTNYQAPPNNQNTANNNPLSVFYQPHQTPHQVRSISNNLPQQNTAQHQPSSYSENYHASNPKTTGQNVPSPGQSLSTSGSYVPHVFNVHYYSAEQETPEEAGVMMMTQTNTEKINFWP